MPASNAQLVPVPRTLADSLEPSWLNSALRHRFPDIRITRVTQGPVVSRVSTNVRFHVEGEDGLPDGLPPDLCVKGYFADWSARRAGMAEALFYRHLSAASGVRTLRSVYADVDPEDEHGVVITEDVVAQGGRFLDGTSTYTVDQAAESLTQLAVLHASSWCDPAARAMDWLASRLELNTGGRGVKEIRGNFECEIGAGVPDEVRDPERLFAAYLTLAEQTLTAQPWSVIHGDAHVGNLYVDSAHQPCFLDWQLVQRGPWYLDVGYHLASALTVEHRRTSENDLLRHYLDALRAGGVEPPSWDEAWQGVRRGILYGFYLWSITLRVDPAITTVLEHRLGTASADHEAFAAVGH